MGFYDDWKCAKDSGIDESMYILDFLKKTPESLEVFIAGQATEVALAVDVLVNTDLELFLDKLDELDFSREPEKSEVPQFSSFENGAIRVPELLQFADDGLTYDDLGYQMVKANRIGACIKYGENHSKLADLMSLVTISKTRPAIVKSTALGKHLVAFDLDEKADVLKKLLLRDYFMQRMISEAKRGMTYYSDVASCLSESTRIRRRSNVKCLAEFILENGEGSHIYKNIVW